MSCRREIILVPPVRDKRRLLMAGRTRYALPLSPSLARKFEALGHEFDLRVLGTAERRAPEADPRFHLIEPVRPRALDGLLFHALFPYRVARELRSFRPDSVWVQGAEGTALALIGRSLARVRSSVIADLHGDPASTTRLYGSKLRKALAPVGDLLARQGLRRADGIRTVSSYISSVALEAGAKPTATFPAFMDLERFLETPPAPLPERPVALFVGVLEPYKAVDVLADAWRTAAPQIPGATLHVVGRGPLGDVVGELVADLPEQTRWTEQLPAEGVLRALDESTVLLLPSRSEGLPRIVVEAFCRERGVIGTSVAGIPDIVTDGQTGLLVEPDDAASLAVALARALTDRSLARGLGATARAAVEPWLVTPEEYAARVRDLVDRVETRGPRRSTMRRASRGGAGRRRRAAGSGRASTS
jgi:glycosyltransferase involved in cell wall biosynthesis